MADTLIVHANRASFGSTAWTSPPANALRLALGEVPAFVVPNERLGIDGVGNITRGPIGVAEIPAAFTRRDVAETIAQPWTWGPGHTIGFAVGTLQPPQLTSRSTGTRVIVYPVPGATEFAIGIEAGSLWSSVPASGSGFKWYQGDICRLRLAPAGDLNVENGSGYLVLSGTGGAGTLWSPGNLGIIGGTDATQTGYLSLNTGSGLITPVVGYKENLGQISRKFLSLHAGELWVETLVAQQTLATIGGRVLVGPTTTLTRDVAPGATEIYTKHNSLRPHIGGVEYGSKLVLQVAGKLEVMSVLSTSVPTVSAQGDYGWAVNRAIGGTANQWYAGDAVFDTGMLSAPAGAFIDLYSVQGVNAGSTAGPTIVGNVRTGGNAFDWLEHWAVGNLRGLYGNGASNVMGAAFGRPDAVHLQIDATNGIVMWAANNTAKYGEWRIDGTVRFGYTSAANLSFTPADGVLRVQWNGADRLVLTGGDLRLAGALYVGAWGTANGVVCSPNASAWNAGFGFRFDHDPNTGNTTALIGNSAGRRFQWNGTSLKIISDGFTLDENGLEIAANPTFANARSIRFTATGGFLWDTSTYLNVSRNTGGVLVNSGNGIVQLSAGNGANVYTVMNVHPDRVEITGTNGGFSVGFRPGMDAAFDNGHASLRWRHVHGLYLRAASLVTIGPTTSPFGSYQLELSLDAAAKPGSSTWSVISDVAVKTAIEPVDPSDALATVRAVPLRRYRHVDTDVPGIGVIAQEVRALLPRSVRERPDGLLDWNSHELLMLNVAAVQALAARLDALAPKSGDA